MTRPTRERLEQIRKWYSPTKTHPGPSETTIINDLLAEIDALEADLKYRDDSFLDMNYVREAITKERDQLRDLYFIVRDSEQNCIKELGQLRVENEKVKTNQLFEASLSHLFEENVKLKERVAKLREAIEVHKQSILSSGSKGFHDSNLYKALAADDEEGK